MNQAKTNCVWVFKKYCNQGYTCEKMIKLFKFPARIFLPGIWDDEKSQIIQPEESKGTKI